jgi:hypothetical protein
MVQNRNGKNNYKYNHLCYQEQNISHSYKIALCIAGMETRWNENI